MINREVFQSMPFEMLFAILDQLPNPVMVVESNLNLLYANQIAVDALAVTAGEQLGEEDGLLVAPHWEHVTILSQSDSLDQTIFRFGVDDVSYLCFQKHLPEQEGQGEISVLSIQEESLAYDLFFNCGDPRQSAQDFPVFEAEMPSSNQRILSHSPQMNTVLHKCNRCAFSDLTVLFLGESGTGKTMLAEYMHRKSPRRNGPFLVINCAAIAKDLLESELFGYAPYAFTNANAKGRPGLFELADQGTLLLDEIGDMPLDLQAKILTAVETQTILPVGGHTPKSIDVRIVAATNQNLKSLVEQGKFREDLLWRLNTMEIALPPLRERREDILHIADGFRTAYNESNGTDLRFTSELESFLQNYSWPGNIRQLKNTVEKLLFTTHQPEIPLSAVTHLFDQSAGSQPLTSYGQHMEARERRFIQSQYRHHPSTRKLASALGISQSTATRLIKKYISEPKGTTAGSTSPIVAMTRAENQKGRLTQYQVFQVLDVMPQRICVVDQDFVCLAERHHSQQGGNVMEFERGLTSTPMYRAGYKMARVKERPIILDFITAGGKPRQTIITPIQFQIGDSALYASVAQIHFSVQTLERQQVIKDRRKQLSIGRKNFAFFCSSPELSKFLQDADRAAWQDLSVLIHGESGTGKSVFARYLHQVGSRKDAPFVTINCASIPQNLVEAELFGYEKGAFTGADPNGKKGLFELANGGTLFLDEIGDMPLSAQAKFLDVIENKRFIPLGGKAMVQADVRIICATNRDLKELVQAKSFREDLYWRINVIELTVPALRQRPEDVELYASFFLQQCAVKYQEEKRFSPEVLSRFAFYHWPGNLRQLSNAVECSFIMAEGSTIQMEHLPNDLLPSSDQALSSHYENLQRHWEREVINQAITQHGTAKEAAQALKVSGATLSRKRT